MPQNSRIRSGTRSGATYARGLLSDGGSPDAFPSARNVDGQVHDQHHRRDQVPSVERPWEWEGYRGSPAPVEDARNHDIDREKGQDRIRRQQAKLALDPGAKAPELHEHPSDPVAALDQMNDNEASENQPHVCMDGVADV